MTEIPMSEDNLLSDENLLLEVKPLTEVKPLSEENSLLEENLLTETLIPEENIIIEIPLSEETKINYVIKLENETDNATLALFSNPLYLSMINRKLTNKLEDNTLDVKFYRKRLISLFKDMIKGEYPSRELKEAYDNFIIKAIHYFETNDKMDIIQGQHIQGHEDDNQVSSEDNLNDITIPDDFTISNANDLMMKKTINVANLNNYVITKQDESSKDVRIIPMKIEIDLKTPDLKLKGVKQKLKKKKEDLSK
jgi:hypothetical protein